ncbi:acetyl-CoA carboxylase biotin carboxyl carrier protein subunit [Neolewinella antarctica]|uniref:Biotin carboxyl carrier protein n=1 Tax=Neolewinella antarctica TaxID=442734 RepID=A0ABX0XBJ5_9BACT|nr:acetyl-CoA carboxylase biotin carboxyl carrier protein subunit [Neolewinella antarctica]NJC26294.1 biotin carboxyl carrier protein [Neolewinella antarctica]
MPKYQARSSDRTYPVTATDLAELDLHRTGEGTYHLLRNGKAHHVRVLELDRNEKSVRLTIDGQELFFSLLDARDQQIDALGFSATETVLNKHVYAPMPGLVLKVLVAEGAEVTAGTPLIILEAMKMENVLKAEGDGVVTTIAVNKGDAVEKKQLLISVE